VNELSKINEVTARYEITARTLHYYEKIGLIKSIRDEHSNYRLYDEVALTRLKQILILRKMNISIADIGKIFSANNSEAVLGVLGRKVDTIDNEVAHLHELKEIVLKFIHRLRQVDFYNDSDVKLLFDKAVEIEMSLTGEDNDMTKLLDTSDVIDERLKNIAMVHEDSKPTAELINWEIVQSEAMRFVGKSFYGRAGQSDEFCGVAQNLEWVFSALDEMGEYATADIHDAALVSWERYDDTEQLMRYTSGRFMKAGTPVPPRMDYIEIPAGYMGELFIRGGCENTV
jgi:DNA-binding transcriptional MerR regulator